jgi:hypothetical protein
MEVMVERAIYLVRGRKGHEDTNLDDGEGGTDIRN